MCCLLYAKKTVEHIASSVSLSDNVAAKFNVSLSRNYKRLGNDSRLREIIAVRHR